MSEGGSGARSARLRRWTAAATLLAVTGVLLVLGLEAGLALAMEWPVEGHLERLGPGVILLASGLVSALVLGLAGLTGRLRRGIPLAAMAGALLVAVNYLKIRFRGEPLYPSDFAYVGEAELLISSVGIGPAVALAAFAAGVGGFVWLAVVGLGKLLRVPPAAGAESPRWVRGVRVGSTLGAVALAVVAAGFKADGNPIKRAFELSGADWVVWSQNENYRINGFVAGFLYNMPSTPMPEPEGYSREAVLATVDRYADKAREINAFRNPDALDDANVVVILGESFIDPLHLAGFEVAEDPVPFTRGLMGETMAGTMHSVAFGGGTANVEFEVLTGMSTAGFTHTMSPYQGLVAHTDHFPSVLSRFDATHTTVGIHPFAANFYRRGDAYRSFGFDRTKFQDDVTANWKLSEAGYIADGAAYEELLGELRHHDEPVFAKVVTMQNHAGYAGLYPDPIPVLAPDYARDSWGLGDYLRGLKHADDALAKLLAALEALDERTVVLFYGDHAPPSVIPEDLWDAQANRSARYHTPWFVWSSDGVHATRHQGELAPTHLWNQLLRATDAAVTPWDALLLELEAADTEPEQLSAVDRDPFHPALRQVERDHLLLQYDLSVGAGYGAEALLAVPGG